MISNTALLITSVQSLPFDLRLVSRYTLFRASHSLFYYFFSLVLILFLICYFLPPIFGLPYGFPLFYLLSLSVNPLFVLDIYVSPASHSFLSLFPFLIPLLVLDISFPHALPWCGVAGVNLVNAWNETMQFLLSS